MSSTATDRESDHGMNAAIRIRRLIEENVILFRLFFLTISLGLD
jgi:hypothetical protein